MFAIRQSDESAPLMIHRATPPRASIGARRNPASTRAILDAAESILQSDGLAGFSMDAIARQARCGKPTLYRWWPDKASLLADLHDRAIGSFDPIDLTESADDRLQQLPRAWMRAWRSTLAGIALRGMLAEAQTSAAAHRVLMDRGFAPYRASIARAMGVGDDDVAQRPVESMLNSKLSPLLGELMLAVPFVGTDRSSESQRRPIMRAVASEPVDQAPKNPVRTNLPGDQTVPIVTVPSPMIQSVDEAVVSLRDRSEWVD